MTATRWHLLVDDAKTVVMRLAGHLRQTGFDDSAARDPSRLPAWSNGHVLTHVARNADGIRRMLEAAMDAQVVDMYPSGAQREKEIELGASRSAEDLLADLVDSQGALDAMWPEIGQAIDATTRRWGFQPWPLEDLAFIRCREVAVHAADLAGGLQRDDAWLPGYLNAELLRQIAALSPRLPGNTPVRVVSTEGTADVIIYSQASGAAAQPMTVEGSDIELLSWLLGRMSRPTWPSLSAWTGVP